MKEVPDKEPQQNGGVLDDGADVLLVVDEEYGNTLKWGQVDTPEPRIQTKSVKDNVPNKSESNRATKGLTISPRDTVENCKTVLEQHLTVICGLAQRQFPRYKSKRHGLTQRRRQG